MAAANPTAQPKIDIHINLAEAGTNQAERAQEIAALVKNSAADYGVVLGLDHMYDQVDGTCMEQRTQLYVSDNWVFEVCDKYSHLLPGPSLNPYRRDAVAKLDEIVERGAVLIKWLPAVQNIDPSDKRLIPFYERAIHHRIPILVHTSGEKTLRSVDPTLGEVRRLIPALDMGATFIVAHSATCALFRGEKDQTPLLRRMLEKFKNLYVDNSGMANRGRFRALPAITRDPLIASRTLYGSDWPTPINAWYFFPQLGPRQVMALGKIQNPITRDIAIKQALGSSDQTLTRAHNVLINLSKWLTIAK